MNPERFLEALETVLIEERNREGIGRLAEKTVHATLKLYFEPDRGCHEVKVGSLVADVKNESEIIEIQTGSFTPLRRKLEAFLPNHAVRVVYPMAYTRRIVWIEKDGTLSAPPQKPCQKAGQPRLCRADPYLALSDTREFYLPYRLNGS